MELRHLRYFIAVADDLHFRRAAARLHVAQPWLSHQIRQLEEELGVALLERTKRHVQLTEAGLHFLQEVKQGVAQLEGAVQTAKRAARGEVGELRLGIVSSITSEIFPTILRVFRERYPDVELTLLELSTHAQLEELQQDRIKIGFVRLPIEAEGLNVELIVKERLVAALPEAHRLTDSAQVPMAELAREPLILFPRAAAPGLHDLIVGACRQAGFEPNIVHEATHLDTVIGLVAGQLGVGLMPASVQSLQRKGVVYRPVQKPAPCQKTAMVWRQDRPSVLLDAFLGVVREVVQKADRDASLPSSFTGPLTATC
jgi:DNA-binding transcriptional LysR family regulator